MTCPSCLKMRSGLRAVLARGDAAAAARAAVLGAKLMASQVIGRRPVKSPPSPPAMIRPRREARRTG